MGWGSKLSAQPFHRVTEYRLSSSTPQNFTFSKGLGDKFVMVTTDHLSGSPLCPAPLGDKTALCWMELDACMGLTDYRTWEDNCGPGPTAKDTLVARDVLQDVDSNYVVVGMHKYGENIVGGFVLKANVNGGVLWFRKVPASYELLGVIDTEDHDGYIVCGRSQTNGVVLRVAPDGSIIPWIYQFDSQAIYDLERGKNNEFLALGSSWAPPHLTGYGYNSDVLIATIDDFGNVLHKRVYGQATTAINPQDCDTCGNMIHSEIGRGMVIHDEKVYVTGQIVTRDPSCLRTDSLDLFLFAVDYDFGNVLWANRYNLHGSGLVSTQLGGVWDRREMGEEIIVTSKGKIIVAGNAVTTHFSIGMPKQASFDSFLFECDLNGANDTLTFIGGEYDDFLFNLAERSDSVPIAGGYFSDSSDFYARTVVYYDGGVPNTCLSLGMNPPNESVDLPMDTEGHDTTSKTIEFKVLEEYQLGVETETPCETACVYTAPGPEIPECDTLDPQDAYRWQVDTIAHRPLHPFLVEGDVFVENGVHKVMHIYTIPDNNVDFVVTKAKQNGQIEWSRRYGTAAYSDQASCIKATADGNFVIAGVSEAFDDHRNNPFLMKIRPDGSVIWQYSYPNGHNLGRMKVAELESGQFALVGYRNPWRYSESHQPIIIITDFNGTLMHYNRFHNNNRQWDHLKALSPTTDGGFVACGTNGHNNDYVSGYVGKFDAAGLPMWDHEYVYQTPSGIFSLNSGNPDERSHLHFNDVLPVGNDFYVVGYFNNARAGGGSPTFRKGVIGKLDLNGNVTWMRQIYHNSTMSLLFDLDTTSNGELLVTGRTKTGSLQETWLIKTDLNGTPIFSNKYGGANQEHGTWVSEGEGNKILLSGFRRTSSNASTYRAWYMRTDANGLGADICQDTAVVTLDTVDIKREDISAIITQTIIDVETSFDETAACVKVLDCAGTPGKWDFLEGSTEWDAGWMAYPNPGRETLHLRREGNLEGSSQVAVMDLLGRVIYQDQLEDAEVEINTQSLKNGVYLIRLQTGERMEVIRWVKE